MVAPHIKPCDAILELGCGNSGMGAALAADGFSRITCTDLSATVVGKMRAKAAAAGLPITYQVSLIVIVSVSRCCTSGGCGFPAPAVMPA